MTVRRRNWMALRTACLSRLKPGVSTKETP